MCLLGQWYEVIAVEEKCRLTKQLDPNPPPCFLPWYDAKQLCTQSTSSHSTIQWKRPIAIFTTVGKNELNKEAEPESTLRQMQSEDATGTYKPIVNDWPGKARLLQDRHFIMKAKASIKQLVTDEMLKLIQETLNDNLRTSFQSGKRGFRSAVYSVDEQVILELLCQDIIEKTFDGDVEKRFTQKQRLLECLENY